MSVAEIADKRHGIFFKQSRAVVLALEASQRINAIIAEKGSEVCQFVRENGVYAMEAELVPETQGFPRR